MDRGYYCEEIMNKGECTVIYCVTAFISLIKALKPKEVW